MTNDPDIKELLGRAFGEQEPPLSIDRDEVFRTGRKRLRRRRVFEAGGVVAAVVVAAVGATLLTGVVGDPDEKRLPPAASSGDVAPPGPDLPLTTTKSGPVETATTGPAQPPSSIEVPLPLSSKHADELTDKLYRSNILTGHDLVAPPGGHGKPKFVTRSYSYVFEADVLAADLEGSLQVTVEAQVGNVALNCGDMPQPGDCGVDLDRRVAVSTWSEGKVSRRVVRTILPDGSMVTAVATNRSYRQLAADESPNSPKPPVSEDDLVKLVLEAGLRVR
jgi:hypothetical protein